MLAGPGRPAAATLITQETFMLSALLLAASLAASDAPTVNEAHLKAALDLIIASRADQTFDQMKDPTGPLVQSTIAQFQGCEAAKPLLDEFAASMAEVKFTEEEISATRRALAGVYAEVFSKEELEAMTAFFQSDIGQKMLDRTPEVMQRVQEAMQSRMQANMQKAGERMQTFGPRLDAAYQGCRANAPQQ
jgi:hypothetical protein